jgi:hypothetical protein
MKDQVHKSIGEGLEDGIGVSPQPKVAVSNSQFAVGIEGGDGSDDVGGHYRIVHGLIEDNITTSGVLNIEIHDV